MHTCAVSYRVDTQTNTSSNK